MGQVERYPNGTFCWVDLGTNDTAGAKRFYGGLFGWEFDDLGYMRRREASINDVRIDESERRILGPRPEGERGQDIPLQ